MKQKPASPAPWRIRPAVQAGRFYPASPVHLRHEVESYLAAAPAPAGPAPKAIIAPHAGYRYSGPVAGSAYAALALGRDTLKRVILIGPAHYVPFAGVATVSVDAFATPLGDVPVDRDALAAIASLPAVCVDDAAHEPEHCLEVQLPFLQILLGEFRIVPLLVGDASEAEVADILEPLWGGAETGVVVSSDLSHYLDYGAAREIDQATAEAIAGMHPEALAGHCACGHLPIRGMLHAAARHRLQGQLLDLRNSGDTAGPRDRVVGYGAFAFR